MPELDYGENDGRLVDEAHDTGLPPETMPILESGLVDNRDGPVHMELVTALRITERRKAILCAALSELDARLSRGLANSHIHEETLRWWKSRNVHESEVGELLRLIKDAPTDGAF